MLDATSLSNSACWRVVHSGGNSGTTETRQFDYSFNPITRDEDDSVQGIFNLALKTTDREALRECEARHAILLRLGDCLRPLTDPVEIQTVAARLHGEELKATHAFYVEYSENVELAIVHRNHVREEVASMAGSYDPSEFPVTHGFLVGGEPIVVADVHAFAGVGSAERSRYAEMNMRALLGVPLNKKTARRVSGRFLIWPHRAHARRSAARMVALHSRSGRLGTEMAWRSPRPLSERLPKVGRVRKANARADLFDRERCALEVLHGERPTYIVDDRLVGKSL